MELGDIKVRNSSGEVFDRIIETVYVVNNPDFCEGCVYVCTHVCSNVRIVDVNDLEIVEE